MWRNRYNEEFYRECTHVDLSLELHSRDYKGLDMHKDSLSTVYPEKPWKLSLLAIDQRGDPG
jgi:hypothetical protein